MELLQSLFDRVWVPPAVVAETALSVALPSWIEPRPLGQPVGARVLQASFGAGESEAIALAMEVTAQWLILDDQPARRLAQGLGLPVIGTVGVLLAAKRRGLLPAIRPVLDALAAQHFRMSAELYERVLADAGESIA